MPTPERYLVAAEAMLVGSGPFGTIAVAGGWWPKACACLIRLALELAVDNFWQSVRPEVVRGNWRTKLILLRRRCDRDTARRLSFAWVALSRATHHHCYEMAPTSGELRRLHSEVTQLLTQLPARES